MTFGSSVRRAALSTGLTGAGTAFFWAVATGRLTLDLNIGRRHRPLGPIELVVAAPRQAVHQVISEPYLGRQTRALAEKLRVVERTDDLVIAEHLTHVGSRLVTSTLESVRFAAPDRVDFRLLRGPVPAVAESFTLEAMADGGTLLHYEGTLETDLWKAGDAWGQLVARQWTATVRASIDSIKSEAERRASHVRRADR